MASRSRWHGSRLIGALALLALSGCASPARQGDAFIVAGRHVHTGTRVVTWLDAGGLDAYRTALRDESGVPVSYGARRAVEGSTIAPGAFEALLGVVDQIVLHYDGFGNSRECFEHLAERQLSAHFLIDVDGTVYQTLDMQERAFHATVANNRSIGIEIANVGALPAHGLVEPNHTHRPEDVDRDSDAKGSAPISEGRGAIETQPSRVDPVRGTVHGIELVQPVFAPPQYAALSKLIDALCRTFPRIERTVPRDPGGAVVMMKLSDNELANFRGILGHFHIQENKVDPGPAFRWELILPR